MIEAPPVLEENSPRNYFGWFALTVLFLLSLVSALMSQADSGREETASVVNEQATLKRLIQRHYSPSILDSGDAGVSSKKTKDPSKYNTDLQKVVDKVKPYAAKDQVAAMVKVVTLYEMGKPLNADDLKSFKTSKKAEERAVADIYSAKSLTKPEAEKLSRQVKSLGFVGKLAAVHAMRKAGVDTAEKTFKGSNRLAKTFAMGLIVLVVLAGSGAAWLAVGSLYFSKQLHPLGLPRFPQSMQEADRFAVRAAQIFGLFVVLSLLIAIISKSVAIEGRVAQILEGVGLFVAIGFLMKQKINGKELTLRNVGVSSENLLRHIGIGFLVFFLEFPVTMLLGIIGTRIFFWLPEPNHPAETEILTSSSSLAIFSLLFAAVVVAPFWEELMFRGLMFPALSKLTGKLVWGALISSFVFASIHPQNAGAWLGLASVAMFSCLSMQYTKSLVPSMMMHAAHNGTLMLVALLTR